MPLFILAAAFLWASVTIALRRREETPPGTVVIRIGHFQLESGVRDAFNKLGEEFAQRDDIRKTFGNVKIVQEAIPEDLYGQWLTSQMMAATAPDLVEVGNLPDPILIAYQSRYFHSLNHLAGVANPFNQGTPLEGVALKETFTEGMRSGYTEELQAYTRIPLARFTQRLFYNRTLLKALTGLDAPPENFRAFLDVCRRIGEKKTASGQNYIAIVSSKYHAARWYASIAEPLTYSNLFTADLNRDGVVGSDETYAAFASGRMSLVDAPWAGRFAVTRELSQQFQRGFVGLGRDEAVFLFAQEKGVFFLTGTWDVNSLVEQAAGSFDVGVTDFPRPGKDDPEFGRLVFGPVYDPAGAGFPFGVTRFSKHPDVAQAFLLFLASYRGNARLNDIIGWIPIIRGAPSPAALAKFSPVEEGVNPEGSLVLGGDTLNAWNRVFSHFETDPRYSYTDLVRDFEATYKRAGPEEWLEKQREWQRGMRLSERTIGGMRGEAMLHAAGDPSDPRWLRYRSAMITREIYPEIDRRLQERIVMQGAARPVAAYDYLPEALDNIKNNSKIKNPNSTMSLGGGGK